jgi:peptidoglycan/LPS O-acetylase OafA/YrhL
MLAVVSSMTFARRADDTGVGNYLWRRLKRIFPIYLFINVLIFAASYFYPPRLGHSYSIAQLLLSVLGLSQYVGQPYLSEVFWFIPFIIQVYVVIGLFRDHLLKLNWKLFFLVGTCISGFAIWILSGVMGDALFEMRKWSPILRLPEVGFGFMTAAVVAQVLSPKAYWRNVAVYVSFIALLACGSFIAPHAAYLFCYPLIGLGVSIFVAVACYCLLFVTKKLAVSARALRFIGRTTFPFFLIHGVGMRFVSHKYSANPVAWFGYLFFCMAAALCLEWFFGARIKGRSSSFCADSQK